MEVNSGILHPPTPFGLFVIVNIHILLKKIHFNGNRNILGCFDGHFQELQSNHIEGEYGKVFETDATFGHEMKRVHNAIMKAHCCASDRH